MVEQRTGVVRTTISIPQDIKDQMDAVEEPVNWSAVATGAFEEKLGQIAAQKKEKSMEDVIQRLRASKRETETYYTSEGLKAGKEWAINDATWSNLRDIGEKFLKTSWDVWLAASKEPKNPYTVAHRLAGVMYDEEKYWELVATHQSFEEFIWEAMVGPDNKKWREDTDFLRGFVEGAIEVYKEVRDRV